MKAPSDIDEARVYDTQDPPDRSRRESSDVDEAVGQASGSERINRSPGLDNSQRVSCACDPRVDMAPRVVGSLFALKQVAPRAQTRGELIQPLGGSLLTRGLWYRAKLKNILGDFRDRPGFRSSLQDHIGFHDLATDWPQ